MAPRDMLLRYLKHSVPDGDYAIEGPGIDMTFYRISGIVYPSGGTMDGVKVDPRSREECVRFYGVGASSAPDGQHRHGEK